MKYLSESEFGTLKEQISSLYLKLRMWVQIIYAANKALLCTYGVTMIKREKYLFLRIFSMPNKAVGL